MGHSARRTSIAPEPPLYSSQETWPALPPTPYSSFDTRLTDKPLIMRPSDRIDEVQDADVQAATRPPWFCMRAGMCGAEGLHQLPPCRPGRPRLTYVAFTEPIPGARATDPTLPLHEIEYGYNQAVPCSNSDELYDDVIRPAKLGTRTMKRRAQRSSTPEDTPNVDSRGGQPGTPSVAVSVPLGPPVVQRPQCRGHMRTNSPRTWTPWLTLRAYVGASYPLHVHDATYREGRQVSSLSGRVTVCSHWCTGTSPQWLSISVADAGSFSARRPLTAVCSNLKNFCTVACGTSLGGHGSADLYGEALFCKSV
ncbi:hypothetical protein C8Q78DRAFT_413639 [Trametes maxima]|nr:hypothetical protein C8Q78DRAFT_413639 [Trametes maxima]